MSSAGDSTSGVVCTSSDLLRPRKTQTHWSESSEGTTKMVMGLENLIHEERLRELWLFRLETAQEDLSNE